LLGYADASSIWTNFAGIIVIWEGSSWQIRLRHLEQTKDRAVPVKAEAVPVKAALELAAPDKVDLDQARVVLALAVLARALALAVLALAVLARALALAVLARALERAALALAVLARAGPDRVLAVHTLAAPDQVLAVPTLAEHRHPPVDPVRVALVRVDAAAQVTRVELEEQPALAWPGPGAWRVPVREVPVKEVTVKEVPAKEAPIKEGPARPVGPLSRLVRPSLEVLMAAPDRVDLDPALAVLELAALERAALERAVLELAALERAALERAVLELAGLELAALEVMMVVRVVLVVPVVPVVGRLNRKASWVRSVRSPLVASTLAVAN
jgi:hypothetical protein